MEPSETVCFNIKTAWHAIHRMYNYEAVKEGISTSIGFVLLNIDEDGTPATKIAPLIGLETRSLTRMLKNLEDTGLIYRASDKSDKRMVSIFLTPLGKEKRKAASRTVKAFNTIVREKIPADKLDVFFDVINQILKSTDAGKNEIHETNHP